MPKKGRVQVEDPNSTVKGDEQQQMKKPKGKYVGGNKEDSNEFLAQVTSKSQEFPNGLIENVVSDLTADGLLQEQEEEDKGDKEKQDEGAQCEHDIGRRKTTRHRVCTDCPPSGEKDGVNQREVRVKYDRRSKKNPIENEHGKENLVAGKDEQQKEHKKQKEQEKALPQQKEQNKQEKALQNKKKDEQQKPSAVEKKKKDEQ